ncbi:hypothetical protein MMC34_000546 [Xylographa carneopallida]|nr:hypothetical protein [Xylographa carneopallida]
MSETNVSEDSETILEGALISPNLREARGSAQSQGLFRSEDPPASEEDSVHEESFPPGAGPSTAAFLPSLQITLQVGERRFTTTEDTLTHGSHYFARMFSGRWPCEAQEDGSYFVDADGSVFEHTLRYLRHNVFPLHYDHEKGHDFGLCAAILEQARFFGIDKLEKWLGNKDYLEAVKTEHHAQLMSETYSVNNAFSNNVELEYHPSWTTKRVYVCPRGISVHRGNPNACGRACRSALGITDDPYVKEQELKMIVIKKTTIFMQELCFSGAQTS